MIYFYQLVGNCYKYGERVFCYQPQSKDWGPLWYQRMCFLYSNEKDVKWRFILYKVTPQEDGLLFEVVVEDPRIEVSL